MTLCRSPGHWLGKHRALAAPRWSRSRDRGVIPAEHPATCSGSARRPPGTPTRRVENKSTFGGAYPQKDFLTTPPQESLGKRMVRLNLSPCRGRGVGRPVRTPHSSRPSPYGLDRRMPAAPLGYRGLNYKARSVVHTPKRVESLGLVEIRSR